MSGKKLRVSFNAPVTLTFCLVCFAAMLLNTLTGGYTNKLLFSIYRSSWTDLLTYIRLVGHAAGHSSWDHFFGNMMYMMILGPMLEEKYGARDTITLYLATALVTGVMHLLLFPGVIMMGASGIVFALIMLSSFTKGESGTIPLTFLIVACLYIGQQVYDMIFTLQNVAYAAHFCGGAVGAVFGWYRRKNAAHSF